MIRKDENGKKNSLESVDDIKNLVPKKIYSAGKKFISANFIFTSKISNNSKLY